MSVVAIFDVDGTLIDLAGAGSRAMALAFESSLGLKDALNGVSFAGRTDLGIVRSVFETHGLPFSFQAFCRFIAVYEMLLPDQMARTPYRPTPGAMAYLRALEREPGVILGLATGNTKKGALAKLQCAGIEAPFEACAFGDEYEDRADLVRAAVALGAERGAIKALVFGDTPRDVSAAHAAKATAVAVAQGPFSSTDLAATGAEHVVKSLRDAQEMRLCLEGSSRP